MRLANNLQTKYTMIINVKTKMPNIKKKVNSIT